MSRYRFRWVGLALTAALLAAVLAGVCFGVKVIPLSMLLAPESMPSIERTILLELRLPRVILATLIGAALASAGTAYQSLFRNPLADPFVIGASSGAALGATAAVILGWSGSVLGLAPLTIAAFVGTLLAVAAVYSIGGVGARASPLTLLLAGAALSTMLGAVVSLAMLLHDESLQVVFVWLLGGLAGRGWPAVGTMALYAGPAMVVLLMLARPLDALAFGDDAAQSFGLSVRRSRVIIVAAASLATAAAVAQSGLIGFVGLIAPHSMRLLLGSGHARLLPAAALAGALLLVVADIMARVVAAPLEIPVGVMTALMGGPFFLVLLRTRLVQRGDGL